MINNVTVKKLRHLSISRWAEQKQLIINDAYF